MKALRDLMRTRASKVTATRRTAFSQKSSAVREASREWMKLRSERESLLSRIKKIRLGNKIRNLLYFLPIRKEEKFDYRLNHPPDVILRFRMSSYYHVLGSYKLSE